MDKLKELLENYKVGLKEAEDQIVFWTDRKARLLGGIETAEVAITAEGANKDASNEETQEQETIKKVSKKKEKSK